MNEQIIRPKLALFHPNVKGTGCAVKFELHPAHEQTPGSIWLTIAKQMTVGTRSGTDVTYSRFDWANSVSVKLDFNDLCHLLQVLRGEMESISDGRGLFHSTPTASTRILFRHIIEPVTGYSLDIIRSRRAADDSSAQQYHFVINSAEAIGLCEAISTSMGVICFGLPVVIPRVKKDEDRKGDVK